MSPVFLAMVGVGLLLNGGAPEELTPKQELISNLLFTGSTLGIVGATSGVIYSEYRREQNIKERMRRYKQQNNTAIQSALRLGGGEVVHDMGKILALDTAQTKRLGRYLRAKREPLSTMTDVQFAHALYVFAASQSTP